MVWDWAVGCQLSDTVCEKGLTGILPRLILVI